MLATPPHSTHHRQQTYHSYLPANPSPLSPRSANIYGRYHDSSNPFMTSSSPSSPKTDDVFSSKNTAEGKPIPFAKRPVKKAPSPKQDELKERRRRAFLRRVQESREDKRFEGRGDDIMRLDFLQRRRAWEAQQAAAASDNAFDLDFDLDDFQGDAWAYDLPASSSGDAMQMSQLERIDEEEELVDDVLQQEDAELEALIASMPLNGLEQGDGGELSEHFGSDDDEFDDLFCQLMETEQIDTTGGDARQQMQQGPSQGLQDGEAMDTS